MKLRYSIEPTDRIYVKGYGFLSFAKKMNNKYSQKLLDSAKKSRTDAIKTTSKGKIQKIAEATDDLIGNKIADKIKSVSKSSQNNLNKANNKIEIPKEYTSPEKRQQIIDELRLVRIII